MGFREWLWLRSYEGRAWEAHKRGDLRFQVTLQVHNPTYRRTLDQIQAIGWTMDERVDHARVKKTDVTPQADGGHQVVRTVTQDATFYFVRAELPWDASQEQLAVLPPDVGEPRTHQPSPGWYQTEHGLRWWDGSVGVSSTNDTRRSLTPTGLARPRKA